MTDKTTTLLEIKNKIKSFSLERDWIKTENAKDLVMALSVEASELLEIFQWVHSDNADDIKNDPQKFEHLQEEIADVLWYLVRLSDHYEIDITKAIYDKEIKNARKYPAKMISEQKDEK